MDEIEDESIEAHHNRPKLQHHLLVAIDDDDNVTDVLLEPSNGKTGNPVLRNLNLSKHFIQKPIQKTRHLQKPTLQALCYLHHPRKSCSV